MSFIPSLGELIGRPPRQREGEPLPTNYMAALTLSSAEMHAWTWQGWLDGGCDHRGDVVLVSQEQLDMFVQANRVRFDVLRMMQTASGAVIDYRRDGQVKVIRPPAEIKPNQYWRCNTCGHVMGPQGNRPGGVPGDPYAWVEGCPMCHGNNRRPTGYSPTEVHFPPHVDGAALDRDTRDVEAEIRRAVDELAPQYDDFRHGYAVPLEALRERLGHVDRETLDVALSKLGTHRDVHLDTGRVGHKQANEAAQRAALPFGGEHVSRIRINPDDRNVTDVLQSIRSADRAHATSMAAPLSDQDVRYIAERMDVDTSGTTDQVRERIVDRADANCQAWRAAAIQEETDGKLLYRADNDPAWVASWSPAERQAAYEAAERMLQWRGGNSPDHTGFYERARRWL